MKDPVVIYSGEHGQFWGPDGSGYYNNHFAAGIYEREDAIRRTSHCGKEKQIEILVPAPNHPTLLQQRIAALEAQVAELTADKERLDKLGLLAYDLRGSIIWHNSSPQYYNVVTMRHGHFPTVRAALDAIDAGRKAGV